MYCVIVFCCLRAVVLYLFDSLANFVHIGIACSILGILGLLCVMLYIHDHLIHSRTVPGFPSSHAGGAMACCIHRSAILLPWYRKVRSRWGCAGRNTQPAAASAALSCHHAFVT